MPGSNLTRTAAAQRSAAVRVESYDVTLDLSNATDPAATTFHSRTEIRFTAQESDTFVDIVAAEFHEVLLNDVVVDTSGYDPENGLRLTGLGANNVLIVDAACRYMNTGEGMHRFVDPADGETYLYTQFESREAHRVYACFDQPDMKARFTFHVIAPNDDWRVFSNGIPQQAGSRWDFGQTVPVPTYITAIVAGPYVGVQDQHDGIPLGVYARRSMEQFMDADEVLTITKQGLDFFHREFDFRYPFGKYDQIFVPEFNAGAMENAGCVTHSDEWMLFRSKTTRLRYEQRAETILHEMAHMWFGNLVTMRWWNDLWLNESFAEWAGYYATVHATQYDEAWTSFCTVRKAWGMRQDQLSSTHPVATDAPDVLTAEMNFDGITYAKGASLLKQLVAYVGEDTFLSALRGYFKAHAFGNAELGDLLRELADASGRDMAAWSAKWIETAGVNTLRPSIMTRDDAYESVTIEQTAIAEHPTLRPHRLFVGLYDDNGTVISARERIELDVDGPTSPVPALDGKRQPALLLLNDGDQTYAKIRLDPLSTSTVVNDIARVDDALARALVWGAAWDMNRDAELPSRDYVRMGVRGLPSERELAIVQAQLAYQLAALDRYTDASWQLEGYQLLAGAAWQALNAAEPGGDLQLVWARTFAAASRVPEDLSRVAGILRGDITISGLAIDTDLRWHLLQQLVARGEAGEVEIAAENDRDNTDAGARMAALCRALMPTAAAKEQAWQLAVHDTSVPNQTSLAIMRGFGPTEQADLLAPYVDKYFAVLPQVWRERTSEVAGNITEALFPSWEVTPRIVQLATDYLASNPDAPAAQRRLINEGRDALERALRARACDAAS